MEESESLKKYAAILQDINDYCIANKVTRAHLSKETGYTKHTIDKMFDGEFKIKVIHLIQLADAAGCKIKVTMK